MPGAIHPIGTGGLAPTGGGLSPAGVVSRTVRGLGRWIAAFLGLRPADAVVRDEAAAASRGWWVPVLALECAAAVYVAALAANASRAGEPWAVPGFYAAMAAVFLPAAARVMRVDAARAERLGLVAVVTLALFAVRIVRAPAGFVDHDEFLHWATADAILETGRLFLPNPLLPVSPLYPGLELATTAFAGLSGASVFTASLVVLGAGRLALMTALFLFFERAAGSARIAAVACLFYMGSSTFLIFDAHFSYESLAVPFLGAVLCAVAPPAAAERPVRVLLFVLLPLLVALATTHHLTSYFAAAFLCAAALLEPFRAGATRRSRLFAGCAAAAALAIPVAWSTFVGNATSGYLGPVLANGLREVAELATRSSGRELFVSSDGSVTPLWQRTVAMGGVVLVCLGLLTGFLRSLVLNGARIDLRRPFSLFRGGAFQSSALIVLTLLTLAYPVGIVFRLTQSGWEIGNRLGSFSFFGVAVVLSVAACGFWLRASRGLLRTLAVAAAATVVLLAGVIASEGPRILVPARYEVANDSSSIESMGISAAAWTRDWLGPRNVFASDRINRLLLATYGRQTIATTLQNWRDTSIALLAPTLGPAERALLRQSGVDYILADLRLTTALPGVGVYFDGGTADRNHVKPPPPVDFLKFNAEPSVDRVFDDGFLVIFDVRRLGDAR